MSEPASTPHTRQALLEAARELFSSRGYEGVGIREIAERAGANIASINYYFGSKSALYLETVRATMADAEEHSPWTVLRGEPADAETAATLLTRFVRGYLGHLGESSGRPACGRLMLWEAVHPSEAIDDVVRDYIAPSHVMLNQLVARLLGDDDARRVRLHSRSILGQVLHYFVFHPFIERLDAAEDGTAAADEAADHIVRFSLHAMGYDGPFIDRILSRSSRAARPRGVPQESLP